MISLSLTPFSTAYQTNCWFLFSFGNASCLHLGLLLFDFCATFYGCCFVFVFWVFAFWICCPFSLVWVHSWCFWMTMIVSYWLSSPLVTWCFIDFLLCKILNCQLIWLRCHCLFIIWDCLFLFWWIHTLVSGLLHTFSRYCVKFNHELLELRLVTFISNISELIVISGWKEYLVAFFGLFVTVIWTSIFCALYFVYVPM